MFPTCIGVGYCSRFPHYRYKMYLDELKSASPSMVSQACVSQNRKKKISKYSENDVASKVSERTVM